jgi:glycosyltransferase involved in cell wall biosynthesis
MKPPVVSIVIPTLNAGKFLSYALNSIVNQSFTEYEVVICDGGSTDQTLEIAASFSHTRVIRQQDIGLSGAWNDGIRAAAGKYIAFLDSDDVWTDSCLASHTALLEGNPGYVGSIGHVEFFLEADQVPPSGFKMTLLQGSYPAYMPGCFMGRRELFGKTGLFETSWKIAGDLVWFAKLKRMNLPLGMIGDTVLRKRVHNNNLSYTTAKQPVYDKELLMMLRELIRR